VYITHVAAQRNPFSVIGFKIRVRRQQTKANRSVTSAGPEMDDICKIWELGENAGEMWNESYMLLVTYLVYYLTFRNVELALNYMTSLHNMVYIIITAPRASNPKIKACK
jgi:hypothetical protein